MGLSVLETSEIICMSYKTDIFIDVTIHDIHDKQYFSDRSTCKNWPELVNRFVNEVLYNVL